MKLKLQCVTCHASAQRSVKAEDNNLPQAAICASCHKDARAIKQPRQTLVTRFSHQQHLKLGNVAPFLARAIDKGVFLGPPGDERSHLDTASKNACVGCHRGLDQSDQVSEANFPRMSDCLVCHTNIEPPFSCETCHTAGPALVPASHNRTWLDFHSSGKANLDKLSCQVCHGRKFTCRGCH